MGLSGIIAQFVGNGEFLEVPSNLSRTLKMMERYGIVELKKVSRSIEPVVKASQFSIQYDT